MRGYLKGTLRDRVREVVGACMANGLSMSATQQAVEQMTGVGLREGAIKHLKREVRQRTQESAPDAGTSQGAGGTMDHEVYTESAGRASLRVAPHVLLRAAVVDIECTDFGTEGYAGYLMCVCVLPLDADAPTVYRIQFDERGDDRRLVREVMGALAHFDILIGHNLAAFDLNWLHSRWMFHDARGAEVGDWRRWLYVDTYQGAKQAALKTRKGLGNLGDYFGLGGEKTAIYRTTWNDVRSPYPAEFEATMADVVYHCAQDVILNRNLFDVTWDDAMSRNANPLKVSKWGYIPGNKRRDAARENVA